MKCSSTVELDREYQVSWAVVVSSLQAHIANNAYKTYKAYKAYKAYKEARVSEVNSYVENSFPFYLITVKFFRYFGATEMEQPTCDEEIDFRGI